jgi:hypothetical protein
MKYGLSAAFLSGLLAVSAFAHGGAEHVTGFARTITATSVTVETTDHKMVTILLRPTTEIKKSGAKAKIGDLKVGDRVLIHAEENKAEKLEAEEIDFGPAPAK